MAETRKYTRAGRRNIIDANNVVSRDGEYAVICAPIGALQIARQFLAQRGLWRTSYAAAYNDNNYDLPDDATMAVIEQQINEFLEATNLMDCNDLTAELSAIEQAISALSSSGGCGCGSGGAGGTEPPGSTTDTGDITGFTGTPPNGYPDWNTYQQAKCDIAHWIVQNLIDDLTWLQTVSLSSISASALGTALASVLPATILILLYAALVSLIAYSADILSDIEDQVIAGFSDLLCALVAGETAEESQSNYTNALNDLIDVATADTLTRYLAKEALSYFASYEQINLMYADYEDTLLYQIPDGQDCGDCGVACSRIDMEVGSYVGGGVFEPEFADTRYRLTFFINWQYPAPYTACGPMREVTLDSAPGFTPTSEPTKAVQIQADDGPFVHIYNSDTFPTGTTFCCRTVTLKSTTPFTLYTTWGDSCV